MAVNQEAVLFHQNFIQNFYNVEIGSNYVSNPRGLSERARDIILLEAETSAASFVAITRGTVQMESRKLEEYLRYELEVYDEGFDQVFSDSSELPEDPLERAKLVIRFNFSSLIFNLLFSALNGLNLESIKILINSNIGLIQSFVQKCPVAITYNIMFC